MESSPAGRDMRMRILHGSAVVLHSPEKKIPCRVHQTLHDQLRKTDFFHCTQCSLPLSTVCSSGPHNLRSESHSMHLEDTDGRAGGNIL